MSLGTLFVLAGVILAAVDAVVSTTVAWLLHVAVILIGVGVLVGAAALVE
jgi:hypothetical protein